MTFARVALMLAGLTGLFLAVGYLLGGQAGMILALLLAGGMNAFAYWNSDKMVLKMHNAREVDGRTAPEFHALVADLARRGNMPMPKVYLIDTPQPNAFATGRNPQNAAVAATTGLIGMLSREELAGVMAHELGHVRHHDTLTMTLTATLAGAVSMLANFAFFFGGSGDDEQNPLGLVGTILMMIFAPLAAMLVQMAISRTAEYRADRAGAELCGHPEWLASALDKIERGARQVENPAAERNPATAHLFIVNPLSGKRMDNLFATHPATENRIARLQAMVGDPATPHQRAARGAGGRLPGARPRPWG